MATSPAPNESPDNHSNYLHFATAPDHIYLSPSFYSNSLNSPSSKCLSVDNSKMIVSHVNGKSLGQAVLLNNTSKSQVFQIKSEFEDSASRDYLLEKSSYRSSADFTDDDDDSNDTKSCSSSSGCSSSSNSMVGSVNRHLSMNSQHHGMIQTTTSAKNVSVISSLSSSQYKELTPKQVKRRLDWDPTPEAPLVAKTTMTAVNGKPVSVRTFKLSNAMKQSLVASGCSKAVAVAAFAAARQTNVSSEKLITSSSLTPNASGHMVTHQSPTAIAIVNGSSTTKSFSPTLVTNASCNGTPPSPAPSSQVIFKTPLAPKSSTSINQQVIILNNNDMSALNSPKSNGIRLTPILANINSPKTNGSAKGVKRARTTSSNNGANSFSQNESHLPTYNESITSKPMNSRSRANSSDSISPLNSYPSSYICSSTSLYNSTSPYSPNSSECNTGRKSGRTRQETSLGQLTRKFISLLEGSPDGSINLNEASDLLHVQKRRIYDITNVLEGVGLLHKTSKNNIQWRGGLFDYCAGKTNGDFSEHETHYRNRNPPPLSLLFSENQIEPKKPVVNGSHQSRVELEHELLELENDENRINKLIDFACEDLNQLKSNSTSLLFANYMDLRRVPDFKEQTVIGIRPPMDTTLEVSDPSENLQIWLKNSRGEMIEVYLCPQSPEDEESNQSKVESVKFDKTTRLNEHNIKTYEQSDNSKIPIDKTNGNSDVISHTDQKNLFSASSDYESGYNSYFGSSSNNVSSSNKLLSSKEKMSAAKNPPLLSSATYSPTSFTGIEMENSLLSSSSIYDDYSNRIKSEPLSDNSDSRYAYAFISQDDDFGSVSSRSYLPHTEDQFPLKSSTNDSSHQTSNRFNTRYHSPTSSPIASLIPLDPPDDYNFTLCENEGIVALFDDEFGF